MDGASRRLVLGLGNPGPRYQATRHNVGWRVVETLAARWRARETESGPVYRGWMTERNGREAHLIVPLTFMNRSGEALAAWMARHDLDRAGLLVVSDDVYLPLEMLRFRPGGSSGGHRGLESIETALATDDWARLRLGVGAAEDGAALREHVLETFGPDEVDRVETMITRAADAVECWLDEGIASAMNRWNRRATKEVQEP
jgi:peptidyl-tRNA hydrolase, PTH1 family